jgi:hypothetical protein
MVIDVQPAAMLAVTDRGIGPKRGLDLGPLLRALFPDAGVGR